MPGKKYTITTYDKDHLLFRLRGPCGANARSM